MTLKKKDNSEYEPDSLTSIHRSIARKLDSINYGYNIVEDREFKLSRQVLAAKRRELKQQGLGNRKKQAEELSETNEQNL
jgi:hypothetical protein